MGGTIGNYLDKQAQQLKNVAETQRTADALDQQGVKPSQLDIQGLGSSKPIASNKSSPGRSKNRRVELKINVDG